MINVGSSRAEPLAIKDGERIVLIGNTLIEREQRYGYWEAALTRRFPDKRFTFRNLGWSGDTVFADARGIFDAPSVGFTRLIELTKALNPTLILVSYGTNESFGGEAGMPGFIAGYNKLLDALAPTKAKVILIQPLRMESKPHPLPSPTEANKNLSLYQAGIRDLGTKRGLPVVDLSGSLSTAEGVRTDNGMHLTDFGYWDTAIALERALDLPTTTWNLELNSTGKVIKISGAKVTPMDERKFSLVADVLPLPPFPKGTDVSRLKDLMGVGSVKIDGLPPGDYELKVDGTVVATGSADAWKKGQSIHVGPDVDQAENLRKTICVKNELYFYKWRPQNITYLLGFRKNEQGNNAKELADFDPLIAEKETAIHKLSQPVPHVYELAPKN